jgi:hypothetical protein
MAEIIVESAIGIISLVLFWYWARVLTGSRRFRVTNDSDDGGLTDERDHHRHA